MTETESFKLLNRGQNHDKPVKLSTCCFKHIKHSFGIDGEERVKRTSLNADDFKLPEQDHVAKYDEALLAMHWNSTIPYQTLKNRIWSSLKYGFFRRTMPIISTYLLGYYLCKNLFYFLILQL